MRRRCAAFGRQALRIEAGHRHLEMRPQGGAAGQEERQKRQAVMVPRQFQIAVEDDVGVTAQTVAVEIHEQEGKIVEHVDEDEAVEEFDGVERHRAAVEHTDIVEMQIAVAAAHEAVAPAPVEARRKRLQAFARQAIEPGELFRCKGRAGQRREQAGIFRDDRGNGFGAAEIAASLRLAVESRDPLAQRAHQSQIQRAMGPREFEERVLTETAHHHEPVAGLAVVATEREGAVGLSPDRRDAQIDFRRKTAVDRQFRFAHRLALRAGRIVHIGISDGALELVGAIAGEKHDRAMRLMPLDPACNAVALRLREEFDNGGLVFGLHWRSVFSRGPRIDLASGASPED